MGVYIKGLKIPPSGCQIFAITSSGMVENVHGLVVSEAVEVKAPHGRLIDAEYVSNSFAAKITPVVWRVVEEAPTIIEAEGNNG